MHTRQFSIVTHTGVRGVLNHWRNIDDEQIRAIADRGGVVGVMAHSGFLKRAGGPRGVEMIVEHIEHVLNIGGRSPVRSEPILMAPLFHRLGLEMGYVSSLCNACWTDIIHPR